MAPSSTVNSYNVNIQNNGVYLRMVNGFLTDPKKNGGFNSSVSIF